MGRKKQAASFNEIPQSTIIAPTNLDRLITEVVERAYERDVEISAMEIKERQYGLYA
jgi:hypothetical protein